MNVTLALDPNSLNNVPVARLLAEMMNQAADVQVYVTGDIFGPGTWQDGFGEPHNNTKPYRGWLNNTDNIFGPSGTGQYHWQVVDHRVS